MTEKKWKGCLFGTVEAHCIVWLLWAELPLPHPWQACHGATLRQQLPNLSDEPKEFSSKGGWRRRPWRRSRWWWRPCTVPLLYGETCECHLSSMFCHSFFPLVCMLDKSCMTLNYFPFGCLELHLLKIWHKDVDLYICYKVDKICFKLHQKNMDSLPDCFLSWLN